MMICLIFNKLQIIRVVLLTSKFGDIFIIFENNRKYELKNFFFFLWIKLLKSTPSKMCKTTKILKKNAYGQQYSLHRTAITEKVKN